MRAAVCPEYGPPEVIRIREPPEPVVDAGQALVRVHAAAVNFPDVLFVADDYQFSVPPPFVPGSEFAGTVLAVGDAVDDLQPGDRVSGSTLVGAFAEQVAIAAGSLQPVPEGVDLRDAAAFGVAHSTAHHVLRSVARVEEAEDLIVLGAGGGVGLATVQLGALLGATVTAVASTDEKLRVAASHGARHLIRHHDVDLRAALREVLPDGADVVVDPVGGALAEPALRALRYGGRFVTIGYAGGEIPRIPLNLLLLKGSRIMGFQMATFAANEPEAFARNAAELRSLLTQGSVRPHIGASFPLSEVAAALRHVADGAAVGKVVIEVT